MRIGDVVTTRTYGKSIHFLIIGYLSDDLTGKNLAVLVLLDPSLMLTAGEEELIPTDMSSLFAVPEDEMVH